MQQRFEVFASYEPRGDQPEAIRRLSEGVRKGYRFQTLKGVTGSGKTFTMAKIIEEVQLPTLVISHNKTLAAQLYREFKEFFPRNAVEYLFPTMTITSPRRMSPRRISISRRTLPSTTKSTASGYPLPLL